MRTSSLPSSTYRSAHTLEVTLHVKLPALPALDLTARGLGDRPGRHQEHVRVHPVLPEQLHLHALDQPGQPGDLTIPGRGARSPTPTVPAAHLREDDDPLG